MSKSKSKLVPHELRPANTAQSTIEQNRLTSELKKLERDKNISISQLSASQAVLQKSLRVMVTGGQQSAQDVTVGSQAGLSPAPSLLNPNSSRARAADGTPRSSSRINVIMADPDVLAATSTKSFNGQIIGGQAQLVRKMESNRNVRMSHSSVGSSATHMSRSSMGMIMDGSLYNVPEKGAVTGVQFTEEDVEQGVREHHLEEEAVPSEVSQPAQSGVGSSVLLTALEKVDQPALAEETDQPAEVEKTDQPATAEAPGPEIVSDEVAAPGLEEVELAVPEVSPAARSESAVPEPAPTAAAEASPERSVPPSRHEASSAKAPSAGHLSRTSRTSIIAPSLAPSPPIFPSTISQQAYTRAVERAFAHKCLKHSKFVTDLEMHEFVSKYLLVEQQNENFKRANEFVSQIVETQQMEL